MRLLFDADGIIKLYRASVLTQIVRAFSCAIPQTVYDEVVTSGKERLHQNAEAIESMLIDIVAVLPVPRREQPESGLGAGELGLLSLLPQERDAIVVSDDLRFLALLTAQSTPFPTPVDLLVVLVKRSILTGCEAREALDRLRPAIRTAAYWEARQGLEPGGEEP